MLVILSQVTKRDGYHRRVGVVIYTALVIYDFLKHLQMVLCAICLCLFFADELTLLTDDDRLTKLLRL